MIPLISVTRLNKRFPGVRALHEVQFELMAGEVHALMGENGAGKSTLMKILAGVYTRDTGDILYDGQPVEFSSPREAQALGIGIIHQELQLMNHLTVAQNMFIGREPRGRLGLFLDEDKLNAQAHDILARMHVNIDPRAVVSTLTVAKQQMVEIAKALSFDSRVLIMDEPTSALNDAEIAELFRIIRELKSRGVGIVYISHKMDELKQISDRVTVLRDGEYVATVTPLTLFQLANQHLLLVVGYSRYDMINYRPDIGSSSFNTLPQMTPTQLAFILSTLTVFVVYWMNGQRRQGRNLPPGPKKYPLIGSLLSMPSTLEWETFAKWGQEYSP